jgi:hypothetical protein
LKLSIPAFTAEASLYKASGHYWTGQYSWSAQTVGPVWPTLEVIEVHDCSPGFIKLGEWPNMTCIADPDYPGSQGDDGSPGGGPADSGGGGGKPPPPRSHLCNIGQGENPNPIAAQGQNKKRHRQGLLCGSV